MTDPAPEGPPPLSAEELQRLTDTLKEVRRLEGVIAGTEALQSALKAEAFPLLKRVGSYQIADPLDGKVKTFNIREPQKLVVDAGELLEALTEHFTAQMEDPEYAQQMAEVVWLDCLKDREVDTKDDGRFHAQCQAGRVPAEVIVRVAKYKPITPHIGFRAGG